MESISKRTGKKFTGKIGTLMLKIGVAVSPEPEQSEDNGKPESLESDKISVKGVKPKKAVKKTKK
jgi:uncharacterized protein (DUF736 family)